MLRGGCVRDVAYFLSTQPCRMLAIASISQTAASPPPSTPHKSTSMLYESLQATLTPPTKTILAGHTCTLSLKQSLLAAHTPLMCSVAGERTDWTTAAAAAAAAAWHFPFRQKERLRKPGLKQRAFRRVPATIAQGLFSPNPDTILFILHAIEN
eukprot:843599-Pelagomonas_calceolata.AAC.3